MKPNFALNLSHEGISLLHRAKSGWVPVGEVNLDSANLNDHLSTLRRTATELDQSGLTCKLVIPNSQVLYTELDAPGPTEQERHSQIRAGLAGLTPYDVDDLVYDWRSNGSRVQVAVVAQETLREAESFAAEFDFNPVSFVGVAGGQPFDGEPYFGMTGIAPRILGSNTVEPDDEPLEIITEHNLPKVVTSTKTATPDTESNDKTPEATSKKNGEQSAKPKAPLGATTPGIAEPKENTFAAGSSETQPEPDQEPDLPVTFASRRSKPPQVDPVINDAALAVPKTPKGSLRTSVSDYSALDLDDVPDMPAWRQASGKTDPSNVEQDALPVTAPGTVGTPRPPSTNGRATLPPEIVRRSMNRKAAIAASSQEAKAMTVFGARSEPVIGGKPKFLGLALTILLLLAFGVAALWSTLFFGDSEPVAGPSEIAALPSAEPVIDEPTIDRGLPTAPSGETNDVETTVLPETSDTNTEAPLQSAIEAAVGDALNPSLTAPETSDTGTTLPAPETEVARSEETVVPVPEITAPPPDRISEPPPSPAEAERRYAATGIWQLDPAPLPEPAGAAQLGNLQTASVDTVLNGFSFSDLPTGEPDARPANLLPPPPLRSSFDLDARGLVAATSEGNLSPDGTLVFLGTPPVVPGVRPGTPAPEVSPQETPNPEIVSETPVPDTETSVSETTADPSGEDGPVLTPEQELLRQFRPVARPTTLDETENRVTEEGAETATEIVLADIRPRIRPPSIQEEAEADEAPSVEEEEASDLAIATSDLPNLRPRNVERRAAEAIAAAAARRTTEETSSPTPEPRVQVAAAVSPSIPSRASVARAATEKNAIPLSKVNLIGVYGSPSARRALVRLKNGRYVKVEVGDRVDGGRVAAIGSDELRYVKGGRNITLTMPKG